MPSAIQRQKNREAYRSTPAYRDRVEQLREDRENNYQKKLSPFQKWFTTFLDEKCIDMSEPVTAGDGAILQVGDVCTAIMNCPASEQEQIKSTLVMIDFKNGDVYHFIQFLGKKLSASDKVGI